MRRIGWCRACEERNYDKRVWLASIAVKLLVTVVMALAGLVVGCADSDGADGAGREIEVPDIENTESEEVPASGRAELEASVRGYSEAFLAGDAEAAWELLSERCRDRLAQSEFTSIVSAGGAMYGDAELTEFEVVDLAGNLARVTYRYDAPEIDQVREPWTLEGGVWRNDDC